MTNKQLMEQALKALEMANELEEGYGVDFKKYGLKVDKDICAKYEKAITAIRARLEQPEQEPVAWAGWHTSTDEMMLFKTKAEAVSWRDQYKKGFASIEGLVRQFLPAAPVQEPDEEYLSKAYRLAIEAKPKEKNNGNICKT